MNTSHPSLRDPQLLFNRSTLFSRRPVSSARRHRLPQPRQARRDLTPHLGGGEGIGGGGRVDTSWGLLPVPLPARTPCPGRSRRLPQLPPLPALPVGGRSSGRGALPPRRCPGPLPASPPGNQGFKPKEERVFDEDTERMPAAGCRAGFASSPSTPSVVSGGTLRIILSAFLGGKKTHRNSTISTCSALPSSPFYEAFFRALLFG